MKRTFYFILVLLLVGLAGCKKGENTSNNSSGDAGATGLPADAAAIAAERGLTPDDIYAAVKTYMPTGQLDPYIMFASGGQSGQVLVIGVPSMRILKVIGVFTQNPGRATASAAAATPFWKKGS